MEILFTICSWMTFMVGVSSIVVNTFDSIWPNEKDRGFKILLGVAIFITSLHSLGFLHV